MKYALLSGLLWGADTTFLALLVTLGMSSYMSSAMAYVGIVGACVHDVLCALILCSYMAYRKKWHATLAIIRKPKLLVPIVLTSLLGGPIGMSGYALAARNIGAGYAAAISALYPAFGVVLSSLILKERLNVLRYGAFIITLVSVGLLGYCSCAENGSNGAAMSLSSIVIGLCAALLSVVGWGSEAVVCAWATRQQDVDDEVMLHIRETVSALSYAMIIVPLCSILPVFHVTIFQSLPLVSLAIFVAFLGTASYLCYYRGIARVGATRAMAGNITYAVWAMIITSLVSRDIPSILAWICCVIIIVCTLIVASPQKKVSFAK